jgi:crotonobetainyl-CoA:carnitine CoA-transferase CaiB-like acyl-CoA transferase
MLESVLATMGWAVSNHLIAGVAPQAHGNENPTSAPSGAFEAEGGLTQHRRQQGRTVGASRRAIWASRRC